MGATFGHRWNAPRFVHAVGLSYAAFVRYAARRRMHPMAGGIWSVTRDRDADYRRLRRQVFDIDQLALPRSLALSNPRDKQLYQLRVTA